ncbi:MAG TPA: hypothetical protein VGV57_11895 [Thermoleophilaceae bacterium]|nr:hypothetical protein [Thermoleophilaceae bacterium]
MDLRQRRSGRVGGAAGVLAVAVALFLLGCGELAETKSVYPVKVEPVPGTGVARVTFGSEGARRVGLKTAKVRQDGPWTVIPHGALVYRPDGKAFAYTSPAPLVYVREEVKVERVEGDRVMLSRGPRAGTEVVTVGTAEVYGSEFEVDH